MVESNDSDDGPAVTEPSAKKPKIAAESSTGPVAPAVAAKAMPAAAPTTKFTNETLRAAVGFWCCDRAAALAQYGPIGEWDTSSVTDMFRLFRSRKRFNDDISGWDVSSVKSMGRMFEGAMSFNQPLDKWDVSSVENMGSMFWNATSFNQPLDKWDVSSVTSMFCMFKGATSFNQRLGKWDVSSVTSMSSMFQYAAAFNQPLDQWDVSSVKDMGRMFEGAAAFNQPLDKWDVSSVKEIKNMFEGATSFDQPKTLRRCAEWETLQARSVAELKELCELNGLHKTGVKSDLVARLFDAARLVDALCELRGS